MALGEYRPPNQINRDEDKYGYGRFTFTKIQILYAIIGLLLGLGLLSILSLTGLMFFKIFGGLLTLMLVIAGILIGGLTIPNKNYLAGGGLRIDMYIIRKVKKKFMKKYHVLYCKNIDRDKIVDYRTVSQTDDDEKKPSLLADIKSMFGAE